MDLSRELHPLGHYLKDREELLNQVFSIIKGAKLRAMLTSGLKDLPTAELKELCLEQLEGMSAKRIRYVLAGNGTILRSYLTVSTLATNFLLQGKDLDESSATEDDEDDDAEDDDLAQDFRDDDDNDEEAEDKEENKESDKHLDDLLKVVQEEQKRQQQPHK